MKPFQSQSPRLETNQIQTYRYGMHGDIRYTTARFPPHHARGIILLINRLPHFHRDYCTVPSLSYWAIGVNQNLGISVFSLVELDISTRRFINADFMRHDERWLCAPRDNHISEVTVVCLDVALAGSDGKSLEVYRTCQLKPRRR